MNRKVKAIRDSIYGVSEQFMDDVKVIFDEYRNNSMIFYVLSEGFVSKLSLLNEKTKMLLCLEIRCLPILMKRLASCFFDPLYVHYLRLFSIALKKMF